MLLRERVLRLAFWLAAVFAFVMATLPRPPQLPGEPSDKVQHIIAFVVLAILVSGAYRNTSTLRLLIGLSLFGAAIELVQLIPPLHRDGDWVDWFADTAAAGTVLMLEHLRRNAADRRVRAVLSGSGEESGDLANDRKTGVKLGRNELSETPE
jgi:VanZ family protein